MDQRRRRLLFRATHRGTHETDLLVGGYVKPRLDTLTEADIDALEAVMELPDVQLADWLTGAHPDPSRARRPDAAGDQECRLERRRLQQGR